MTRSNKPLLLLPCLALLLSGCVTRIGDLTVASTRNIDLSNAHLNVKEGTREVAEDCRPSFLGFPLGLPSVSDAADKALAKGHGNIMVDEVTRIDSWDALIVGQNCYQVEGTVLSVAGKRS
jgi:hypothetical protein